ncbi:MAG: DUF3291 domain-containing protein [Caldilineaceae bacterium]
MSRHSFHLAQVNVAQMRAPLTDPLMQDFVAGLDPINRLADQSPGFVWRLQTAAGDATSLRVFDNELIIVNLSVWESSEALKGYVYRSQHVEFLRRRQEWFTKLASMHLAMWWLSAGALPTVEDARAKLEYLAQHGDTAEAFTFRKVFPPPAQLQQ